MKENQNTDYSELLSQMLDGEITKQEEQALYEELAKDSELQAELNDNLKIRSAYNKDYDAYVPPIDSKAFILDKVGLVSAAGAPTGGFLSGVATVIKGWASAGAAALVAIGLGSVIGEAPKEKPQPKVQKVQEQQKSETTQAQSTFKPSDIPMASSKSTDDLPKVVSKKANKKGRSTTPPTASNSGSNTTNENSSTLNSGAVSTIPTIPTEEETENKEIAINTKKVSNQVAISEAEFYNNEENFLNNYEPTPNQLQNTQIIVTKQNNSYTSTEINGGMLSNGYGANFTYRFYEKEVNILGMDLNIAGGGFLGQNNHTINYTDVDIVKPSEIKPITTIGLSNRIYLNDLKIAESITPMININAGFGFGASSGIVINESIGLEWQTPLQISNIGISVNAQYSFNQFYQLNTKNLDNANGLLFGINFKF
jgi:hypothetical protein